jgi:hypothetical protein
MESRTREDDRIEIYSDIGIMKYMYIGGIKKEET